MTRRLFLASLAALLPIKACVPDQDTRPVPVPVRPGPPVSHPVRLGVGSSRYFHPGQDVVVYGLSGHNNGVYRVTGVEPGRLRLDRSRVPVGRL